MFSKISQYDKNVLMYIIMLCFLNYIVEFKTIDFIWFYFWFIAEIIGL